MNKSHKKELLQGIPAVWKYLKKRFGMPVKLCSFNKYCQNKNSTIPIAFRLPSLAPGRQGGSHRFYSKAAVSQWYLKECIQRK